MRKAILRWALYLTPFLAAAIGGALLLRGGGKYEALEDKQQRQAIETADSTQEEKQQVLDEVRVETDSILADTTTPDIPKTQAKKQIEKERNACDQVISACERAKRERDQRIETLERRTGGKLFIVGELGVESPLENLLKPGFEAELGLGWKVDPNTFVEATVTTDKELRVKARRQFRLF